MGEDLTYTMVISDADAEGETATNVVLTDDLPEEVSYVSATPTQGTCEEVDGTVTCDLGSIEADASDTVDIVVVPLAVCTVTNTASEEAELERRLSPPVLAALHEAGLSRMFTPRSLGGLEVDPITRTLVSEEIASHDVAAGWTLCNPVDWAHSCAR